jgi:hypothetical protein
VLMGERVAVAVVEPREGPKLEPVAHLAAEAVVEEATSLVFLAVMAVLAQSGSTIYRGCNMARKAIINVATGFVENVIDIDPDADWTCPVGHELIDGDDCGGPGWSWDGLSFSAPDAVTLPRIDVLMVAPTQTYDLDTDAMIDRPADDIAAEHTELLGLLRAKLKSEDLTWEETQRMLRLERED